MSADLLLRKAAETLRRQPVLGTRETSLAVAEWLDESAGLADALEENPFFTKPEGMIRLRDRALDVARLIVGEDA